MGVLGGMSETTEIGDCVLTSKDGVEFELIVCIVL